MKKPKSFQKLQQRTMIYLQRHHELTGAEVDMLNYIETSRAFAKALNELAEKIIKKWKLDKE